MTPTVRTLALAGLLALSGPSCVAAQAGAAVAPAGPGAEVPFLAQGPLLCGGASAAMMERFWGARGVYAEDYADLVSEEAGGILTGELADAVRRRGYDARVVRNTPGQVLDGVREGLPAIVLLRTGESRYHYVVVVAAGPGSVQLHDPLVGPGRTMDRDGFLADWAASEHWALLVRPEGPAAPARPGRSPNGDRTSGAPAETLPPLLARALEELRAGAWDEAAVGARRYLDSVAPGDGTAPGAWTATAWELLGSARYLAGDRTGALGAWNRQGRPAVDLVVVRGLVTTGFRPVADHLGIHARGVLTPGALRRGGRRLEQLPSVGRGRVDYQPLPDGTVEVRAAVLETRRWPRVPQELASVAVGALAQERAGLELGPLLPAGERWSVGGSWEEARPRAAFVLRIPWTPLEAVATVSAEWLRERRTDAGRGEPTSDLRRARVTVERWTTAATRLGLTVGVDRTEARGRLARLGGSALTVSEAGGIRVGGTVDGWSGGDHVFGRVRLAAEGVRAPAEGRSWRLTVGGSLASGTAPAWVWDGAGTGRIRAPLLRGHPLSRDGRMGAGAFGRGLLHAGVGHAWTRSVGPARLSLELFVDAARVWRPWEGSDPRGYVDPGVEISLGGTGERVALALARGGDDWVVSARVGSVTLPWLSAP